MSGPVSLATPSEIKLTIGGHEVKITSADLKFSIFNGTTHKPSVQQGGNHGASNTYTLVKGAHLITDNNLTVEMILPHDEKMVKSSIDIIKKCIKKTENPDHTKYVEDIVFLISNTDKKNLIKISFKGFIAEAQTVPSTVPNGFPKMVIQIVIYDIMTLHISK